MRSFSGSSFTTFLMFVPLVAIPLLAIFGIPEFTPVNASPSLESNQPFVVSDRDPLDSQNAGKSGGTSRKATASDSEVFSKSELSSIERRENPFALQEPNPQTLTHQNHLNAGGTSRLAGWTIDSARREQSSRNQPSSFPLQRPIQETDSTQAGHSSGVHHQPAKKSTQSFAEFAKAYESSARNPFNPSSENNTQRVQQPQPEQRVRGGISHGPLTWQRAIQRLNELGIRDFRLQPGSRPNEFHFSCSFEPTQGSRIRHRFEAEDSQQLGAVKKVLDQIDRWLARR